MPQVAENLRAWEGSFPGSAYFRVLPTSTPAQRHFTCPLSPEWIESTNTQRKAHVERLLEGIEHRDAEFRFTNARRLLYVLQGKPVSAAGYLCTDLSWS